MPSRQQHKSRYESIFRPSPCSPPNLPSYYDFGFDQPILYQPRSPVYTPQPFGHILGSYTPRPKQPRWQAPSTMTRHKATRSMAPTSFRTRSPPSPVASTFTASSSTPSSASSQSATNGAFGPSYLPLSSWTKGSNVWRSRLIDYCNTHDLPQPLYHTFSDKRGGRTAWSCGIVIGPAIEVNARLWFDGQYVENAAEDAAELALKRLQSAGGRV